MDSKYSVYRKIRYDRTYKTLGKMSWIRVVLGVALLISVLLISGAASEPLAARGHFGAAKTLMVWPWWMETYRPEFKAYIDAGVLYEEGNYEDAQSMLKDIEMEDAAWLEAACMVKLASEKLDEEQCAEACDLLLAVDTLILPPREVEEYMSLCNTVCKSLAGTDSIRAEALRTAAGACVNS